jgi:lipid-A-disaccharide synthase
MKIFFSVGEPSGDLHGANLIRALRRERDGLELVGYGGPEMEAAGCRLHEDLTKLAVMWFLRVLLNIRTFWKLLWRADAYFEHERPDAVVLIDYPGFNWWIARRAKKHGIPVFYYGTPQIWAWAGWRVKKMRRFVDHALCKLPFEADWFNARGCNATYVGHPFFDEVRRHQLDPQFLEEHRPRDGRLVAILPGSRTQEVTNNLRYFLKAAKQVRAEVPDARFALAAFKPAHAELAEKIIAEAKLPVNFPLTIHVKRTPELIHLSACCMAVSGSVSLELLHHVKPTVVLYWITPFANVVQSFFRKVKFITLVNLLTTDDLYRAERANYDPDKPGAEPVVFPEYLTSDDRSTDIARHVTRWLTDDASRKACIARLEQLREQFGGDGASRRGAEYILAALDQRSSVLPPAPNFLHKPDAQAREIF